MAGSEQASCSRVIVQVVPNNTTSGVASSLRRSWSACDHQIIQMGTSDLSLDLYLVSTCFVKRMVAHNVAKTLAPNLARLILYMQSLRFPVVQYDFIYKSWEASV